MEDNSENKNTKSEDTSEPVGDFSSSTNSATDTQLLEAQLQKTQNDILYLKADFENYKKRVIKEQSDLRKYGSEHLVRSILELMDNFERALSIEIKPENFQSFSDGIKMIHSEFKSVMNRFGVSEIESLGKNFDPTIHEAMGVEDSKEFAPGQVCKVFTRPYKLHDRVIRPGRVIIAQEPKVENKT